MEISLILDGSVDVIAPAVVADKKYTTPIVKLLNPVTFPSKTTSNELPLTNCTIPKTSAFCGESACALYHVPLSNLTTSPITNPCEI